MAGSRHTLTRTLMMVARITLSLLLIHAPFALAQGRGGMPDGSKERAGIAGLARLVGQWQGDASVVLGPETRVVTQHEDVVFGAGSTVLMVRGTGRLKDGNPGTIMYEAAALIWYDAQARKLRMRAHRAEGIAVEPEIELRGDTLVWGFEVTDGRVRYTTIISDTEWHEVGHFLRDGAPPFQIMEMRLRRVRK